MRIADSFLPPSVDPIVRDRPRHADSRPPRPPRAHTCDVAASARRCDGIVGDPGRVRRVAGAAALAALLAAAAAAETPTGSLAELIAKASREGTVRVIVEVRPEGGGPPTPETIGAAQDAVLGELTGTDHRLLRRFTTIPFLGLAVSAEALRRLAASPRVAGIHEDVILRPQEPARSP